MLTKEEKGRWIEALRSEKYEQGFGSLRYPKSPTCGFKYCCLGVLCDVLSPEGWEVHHHAGTYNHPYFFGGCAKIALPFVDSLVEMNDKKGASFKEIADYIEENIPC